jgi:hypothetical protein
VAQIVPAYIAYTSTLEHRFRAPICYVLSVQGVPFEDENTRPKSCQFALTLCGSSSWALTMDSEGFYGLLGQIDISKR